MNKLKNTLIIIAIYAVLGLVLLMFFLGYREDLGKQEAIARQEKVMATITSLDPHDGEGMRDTWYDVIYEYNTNGVRYWGVMSLMTYDRDYAKSLIGETVEIYIDGKGNCVLVSEVESFDKDYRKNGCIVMVVIIVVYTVIWIAIIIRAHIVSSHREKPKQSE